MRTCRRILQLTVIGQLIVYISITSLIYVLVQKSYSSLIENDGFEQHKIIINNFYEPRKKWETSNLGTYLFKPGVSSDAVAWSRNKSDIYNILVWKHWKHIQIRHASRYLHIYRDRIDPLNGCSVSNCKFSGDVDIAAADAVLVHLYLGFDPNVTRINPYQLWIFWTDESPYDTFGNSTVQTDLRKLSGIFNWSMTYRYESDVPVPYGRTLPLQRPKINKITNEGLKELIPYWKIKRTHVLGSALMSHCVQARLNFVEKLNKHFKVDLFGNCALDQSKRERCAGHFWSNCRALSKYLFYIVVENAMCQQYITEKSFHNAYSNGAIPVIMGPRLEDCNELLPPGSFLHVDQFETSDKLALDIIAISKNMTRLLSYHAWRNHFEVSNEHGYVGTKSLHLCRICEALNYNERSQKVYGFEDIRKFLDPEISCKSFT